MYIAFLVSFFSKNSFLKKNSQNYDVFDSKVFEFVYA